VQTNRWLRGDTEVKLILNLTGVDRQTNKTVELHIPTVLYQADIQEDVILSYFWFQPRIVEIHPREHGIFFVPNEPSVWVDGRLGVHEDDWSNNILGVQTTTVQKPKKALDLFFFALEMPQKC